MHALGVQRALVFMNFQQRLRDTGASSCFGALVQPRLQPSLQPALSLLLVPPAHTHCFPPSPVPLTAAAVGKLAARNMSVGSLHGELSKQDRQKTLAAFRRGARRALLCVRSLCVPACAACRSPALLLPLTHFTHHAPCPSPQHKQATTGRSS